MMVAESMDEERTEVWRRGDRRWRCKWRCGGDEIGGGGADGGVEERRQDVEVQMEVGMRQEVEMQIEVWRQDVEVQMEVWRRGDRWRCRRWST